MNKQVAIVAVVMGLLALSFSCLGDDAQSKAAQVTGKAMESVKNVVSKGAEQVNKAADGITVKVERFVNPEPHQTGESNLLVSAGRGIGRLVRNVTVEVGRSVGSLGSGAVRLVKHTTGAAAETAREAARRIGNPRGKQNNEATVETKSPSSDTTEAPASPTNADAEAPAELEKKE